MTGAEAKLFSEAAGSMFKALEPFVPSRSTTTAASSGTARTRRELSPEAIEKLIYDVMSSDQGLASLAYGENITGASNTSSKSLMAQDFATKLIGELANITAEQVQEQEQTSTQTTKNKRTVICTELNRQGFLSDELYEAGHPHFLTLSQDTIRGYHAWADHVVPVLRKSWFLSWLIAPIVQGRYLMTTGRRKFTFWGVATIYIGQPICWLIGKFIKSQSDSETADGNVN
jgi:hypothetical protein